MSLGECILHNICNKFNGDAAFLSQSDDVDKQRCVRLRHVRDSQVYGRARRLCQENGSKRLMRDIFACDFVEEHATY